MKYAYWFANIPTLGNKKQLELLTRFPDEKSIYQLTDEEINELAEMKKITKRQAEQIKSSKVSWDLEKEWEKMKRQGIHFTTYGKENYPKRLVQIPDPPYALYYKGKLPKDEIPSVAVIGARNCSAYGSYLAEQFGQCLGKAGIQIISGMARGIDGISQQKTVEAGGNSFAVLGCGVDICYPKQNQRIYESLQEQGGILSEYAIGTEPKGNLFPPRNRIISGLSDAVLVIEAKQKSGTLITVDMALEQGKEVYAIPGRITDALSCGCNYLIKQGAGIVLSPQDFLSEFIKQNDVWKNQYEKDKTERNGKNEEKVKNEEKAKNEELSDELRKILTKEEQHLLQILDITPKSLNQIYEEIQFLSNLSPSEKEKWKQIGYLSKTLLQMLGKGLALQKGNYYYKTIQ